MLKMKLKYKSPPSGFRVNYGFIGFSGNDLGWWYDPERGWIKDIENSDVFCSHQDCSSIRAFRRKLKKAPKGVTFTLNHYTKYNVVGKGTKTHNLPAGATKEQ